MDNLPGGFVGQNLYSNMGYPGDLLHETYELHPPNIFGTNVIPSIYGDEDENVEVEDPYDEAMRNYNPYTNDSPPTLERFSPSPLPGEPLIFVDNEADDSGPEELQREVNLPFLEQQIKIVQLPARQDYPRMKKEWMDNYLTECNVDENVEQIRQKFSQLQEKVEEGKKKRKIDADLLEQIKKSRSDELKATTYAKTLAWKQVVLQVLEKQDDEQFIGTSSQRKKQKLGAIVLGHKPYCPCSGCLDRIATSTYLLICAGRILDLARMKVECYNEKSKNQGVLSTKLTAKESEKLNRILDESNTRAKDFLKMAFAAILPSAALINTSYTQDDEAYCSEFSSKKERIFSENRVLLGQACDILASKILDLDNFCEKNKINFFYDVALIVFFHVNISLSIFEDAVNIFCELQHKDKRTVNLIVTKAKSFPQNPLLEGDSERKSRERIIFKTLVNDIRGQLVAEKREQNEKESRKFRTARIYRNNYLLMMTERYRKKNSEAFLDSVKASITLPIIEKQPRQEYEWYHALCRIMGLQTPRLESIEPAKNPGGRPPKKSRGPGAASNNARRGIETQTRKDREDIRKRRLPTLSKYLLTATKVDNHTIELDGETFNFVLIADVAELVADIICTQL